MRTESDPCNPDLLHLLAEGLLAPAELTGLERHLEWCAGCREALDRLVGGDGCLAAVRRHLGVDPTEVFEQEPVEAESLDFLTPSDWPDSLGRLGTYEVKGVLGRGGMGVVLKAFDPALSRNVAIKVLSASLATCGAARRRFLREAKAAAAVVHEHVVSVFAVVESAGLPFLVMEYVPGRSLQDRLDRFGPLSLTEILRIGMQTAAGLAAAHAQGLVHRDVKPANILLENSVERVRLTDFGLARAAADAGVTHSGVVAGTPHYMAPEQASGQTTDHRADLFSLGSTLYAMCAGHPPFRAESPLAVLRRVCDEEPRPLREINPEMPAWLEAIITRLIAKDPARRYQTATEVAEMLGQCLAHVQQPLSVSLPSELAVPKGGTWGWQRPWAWRAIGALGIAAIALATVPSLAPRERRQRSPIQENVGLLSGSRQSPRLAETRGGPDEIAREIEEAWGLAGRLEARLHPPENVTECDPVSALVQELAQETTALESEIVPAPQDTRPIPFRRPALNPDRRR
jgi:serine/threonine-protein kinase